MLQPERMEKPGEKEELAMFCDVSPIHRLAYQAEYLMFYASIVFKVRIGSIASHDII